jgi:hypothetical protein
MQKKLIRKAEPMKNRRISFNEELQMYTLGLAQRSVTVSLLRVSVLQYLRLEPKGSLFLALGRVVSFWTFSSVLFEA